MEQKHIQFDDISFFESFERIIDLPYDFTHSAHLRLAWLCYQYFGFSEGLEKCKHLIKNYVHYMGAEDKYNDTITGAAYTILAHYQSTTEARSYSELLNLFPELCTNMLGVIGDYYSKSLLFSERAREGFIAPDIKPLP